MKTFYYIFKSIFIVCGLTTIIFMYLEIWKYHISNELAYTVLFTGAISFICMLACQSKIYHNKDSKQ